MVKDNSGRYHVDGELVRAHQETSKQLFLNLLPLLRRFSSVPKIVLAPIPRYLYDPCCSDIEHLPNLESEDHVAKILVDLELWMGDGVQREGSKCQDLQRKQAYE
jgi:hypothetical protein